MGFGCGRVDETPCFDRCAYCTHVCSKTFWVEACYSVCFAYSFFGAESNLRLLESGVYGFGDSEPKADANCTQCIGYWDCASLSAGFGDCAVVWLVPFLSYFWIKFGDRPVYAWFFCGLHAVYLLYFVFFYIPDYVDLRLLGTALQYKIHALTLHDGVFTVLAAALVLVVAAFYRVGLKSNTVYANSGVTVIGIGGDSGSGKSRLKRSLRDLLGTQCIEMEGDGDHRWERGDSHWQKMTHLDPKANFLHRQAQDLLRLKQWKSVNRTIIFAEVET